MLNVNKLKGKIVENGMNVESLAKDIGIDKATLYRKIANPEEGNITVGEAKRIAKTLYMNSEEIQAIFFDQ